MILIFKHQHFFLAPTEWVSTAGSNISLPVLASVTGMVIYGEKNYDLDINFIFEDFIIAKPYYDLFLPPSDIYCEGRKMKLHVPGVPEFFTFNSEAIFYYEPPAILEKPPVWVVSTRLEYYDYLQKVSRVEYKPVDLSHLDDPYAGGDKVSFC